MSKEARPKLLLHPGHGKYEQKVGDVKRSISQSYGRRTMFNPILMESFSGKDGEPLEEVWFQ